MRRTAGDGLDLPDDAGRLRQLTQRSGAAAGHTLVARRPAHGTGSTPRAKPAKPRSAGTSRPRRPDPDRLSTARWTVALTFDAGADDAGALKIPAALATPGVAATFFLTGRWAKLPAARTPEETAVIHEPTAALTER